MKISFALFSALSLGSLVFVACSSASNESADAQGGQLPTSGGATGKGGQANGGTTNSSGGAATGSGGNAVGGSSSGGRLGSGGTPGNGGTSSRGGASSGGGTSTGEKFSFFVTSIGAMRELSGSQDGFGGDLRFDEADGLAGADKICKTIAEKALPGAGSKTWRAFLSTVKGPVNAIDRVGEGPWYDRMGRLVAANKADLLNERPKGADAAIINDLPNENGIPNHKDGAPGCNSTSCPDNHDVLTGTGPDGKLHSTVESSTCSDWTSSAGTPPSSGAGGASGGGSGGRGGVGMTGGRGGFGMMNGNGPWCGHSWPRDGSGRNWMSALAEGGCAPGVNLKDSGGNEPGVYTVGTGGGYGAIYCFALTP